MRNRRFLLLAAALVALNTALWLAPQGLALQQAISSGLFGKSMVRAEVIEKSGADWRLDRGVVLTNTSGVLTLTEADSKVQAITVASSTKVSGVGGSIPVGNIKAGWHVLVTWPALSGPATSVVIEKKKS